MSKNLTLCTIPVDYDTVKKYAEHTFVWCDDMNKGFGCFGRGRHKSDGSFKGQKNIAKLSKARNAYQVADFYRGASVNESWFSTRDYAHLQYGISGVCHQASFRFLMATDDFSFSPFKKNAEKAMWKVNGFGITHGFYNYWGTTWSFKLFLPVFENAILQRSLLKRSANPDGYNFKFEKDAPLEDPHTEIQKMKVKLETAEVYNEEDVAQNFLDSVEEEFNDTFSNQFTNDHTQVLKERNKIWESVGIQTSVEPSQEKGYAKRSGNAKPEAPTYKKLSKNDLNTLIKDCHKSELEFQDIIRQNLGQSGFKDFTGNDEFYHFIREDIMTQIYGKD
jgi:hypothetical protein